MTRTDPGILETTYRHAAIVVEIRALALLLQLKAGFRPEQPRVAAGNPDGGQWVAEGDGSRPILISRRGPRGAGQVRARNQKRPFHRRSSGANVGGKAKPDLSALLVVQPITRWPVVKREVLTS